MSGELETAGLASAGGWLKWKRQHADIPPGTPCANCETPLMGPHCHECGQLAEDFHKSIWKLTVEAVESLLHLDGRLFSTLPDLLRRPGKLTREYLEGKRASQVAPFRMFLVILLVAFFVGHAASKAGGDKHEAAAGEDHAPAVATSTTTTEDADHSGSRNVTPGRIKPGSPEAAAYEREVMADPDLTESEKRIQISAARGDWAAFGRNLAEDVSEQTKASADAAPKMADTEDAEKIRNLEHWFNSRMEQVRQDPARFALILEIWAHRVAILALPVSALMLTVLFAFNRRYYVFDHVIFSMHSLSFQLLLLIVIMGLSVLTPWAWWLLVLAPVHLFIHMKGAYQRSTIGTLARMFVLWNLTAVTFAILAILWLYLGFNEMAGH
ncbi:MAG TPA: DUF3667 domain-containing protein [Brevundimonas sp.]|nr:DUF3667 domain-containing protein [Brevundimonas sp.]